MKFTPLTESLPRSEALRRRRRKSPEDRAGAGSAQKRELIMKKTIRILFLILLLTLFAAACGGGETGSETEKPDAAEPAAAEPAAENPQGGEETAPLTAEEAKEAALGCVGKTTEELYKTIGEPDSSDYAPSCLGLGGEDGNLYYDTYGFIVYTYRENNTETVKDVD